MSATGRSDVREPDDFYATPAWAVRAIHPWLPPGPLNVLDAGAGEGAIADALPYGKGTLLCVENHSGRSALLRAKGYGVEERDFLLSMWMADVIVMNPPFKDAMPFVEKAIRLTPKGMVAALLRLPWLASAGRAAFHMKHRAHILVLSKRPEFCMSCSCGATPRCKWTETRAMKDDRPKTCGGCGGKARITTTDATDYAWFLWGTNSGAERPIVPGQWDILGLTPSS